MANKWREDKCKDCGCALILGTNWTEYRKRNYEYLCKDCKRKRTESYDANHRIRYLERHRINARRTNEKYNKKIVSLLGNKCLICGYSPNNYRIHAHEIHGNPHSSSRLYIINHQEDFAPLCKSCHSFTHFCMRFLGLSWNDITRLRESKVRNEK
jgi:predicted HNH restriction endonuclease